MEILNKCIQYLEKLENCECSFIHHHHHYHMAVRKRIRKTQFINCYILNCEKEQTTNRRYLLYILICVMKKSDGGLNVSVLLIRRLSSATTTDSKWYEYNYDRRHLHNKLCYKESINTCQFRNQQENRREVEKLLKMKLIVF